MLKARLDKVSAAGFVLGIVVILSLVACGSDDITEKLWTLSTVDSTGDVYVTGYRSPSGMDRSLLSCLMCSTKRIPRSALSRCRAAG